MKLRKFKVACGAASVLSGLSLQAAYVDITRPDNYYTPNSNAGLFKPSGAVLPTWFNHITAPVQSASENARENNEVEPGGIQNQGWDAEKLEFDASGPGKLKLTAGFNIDTGFGRYTSGAIFIDTNGDVRYGNQGSSAINTAGLFDNSLSPRKVNNSALGYEYAVVLDTVNNKYSVYALTAGDKLEATVDLPGDQFDYSNAYSFKPSANGGRAPLSSYANLTYNLGQFDDAEGRHYTLELPNLSFLPDTDDAFFHWTIGYGSDTIVGERVRTPDGGATLAMLGAALVGLGLIRRRLQ